MGAQSPNAAASGRPRSELDAERLGRRIRVALGHEAGDLLITGGQVVNVFNRRVEPADVVFADGRIAGVGCYSWQAKEVIDAAGLVLIPGLIDAHMHLESTLLVPSELARLIVPMGTTAVISDSHEVANVLGARGIEMLAQASEGLPLDLFLMASSCVPATAWEDSGAALGADDLRVLLSSPRVLGLAEVMDIPAVLAGAPEILEKVQVAISARAPVDGHAAGLCARDLIAYAAAGIRSDHESTTVEEARARAALGMLVQVRDGSSARNLDTLLPLLASGELDESWCLVTDDVFPSDLRRNGHLDGLLRRVVAGGVPPAVAVRHATYIPARHYGLDDRGALAPGYRADVVLVEDLHNFRVHTVIKDGHLAVRDGRYLGQGAVRSFDHTNTVQLPPVSESTFHLELEAENCPVIEIVPGQIVTQAAFVRGVRPTGRSVGVRSRARRLVDREHRAAQGIGPDRRWIGQRLRPDAHERCSSRIVGCPRLAQPDHCRYERSRHAGVRPSAGRGRRRLRRRRAGDSAGHGAAAGCRAAIARTRRDGVPRARRGQSRRGGLGVPA